MTIFRHDRALLEAFRAGDREALCRVYDHYKRKVEQAVRHGAFLSNGRFAGAPRGECRDLVQETFIRAFSEGVRITFDGISDYEPFLMGITRRVLAEWWRRQGREVASEEVLELAPAGEAENEAPFDQREIEWTQRYLEALPADLLAIHQQRYIEGRSQVEAAEKLAVSRQRIRTLEARLRGGLRKWLQKQELLIKKNQPK